MEDMDRITPQVILRVWTNAEGSGLGKLVGRQEASGLLDQL
jgi:hypothetical protein